MNPATSQHRNRLIVPILLLLFAAVHFFYYRTGLHFDASPLYLNWQILDPYLLKNNLWQSLLYLHSQPPLFNLFLGLALKIFPQEHATLLHLIFSALGLTLYLGLYALLRFFGCRQLISITVAIVFCLTPAFILFEHTLFYPLPLASLLLVAAITLYRFILTHNVCYAFIFFLLLFIVSAISSQFQLPYLLIITLFAALSLKERTKVLLSALVPCFLMTTLCSKNFVLFGNFTTSTWLGMNLMHNFSEAIALEERKALVRDGITSEAILAPPFSPLEVYRPLLAPLPERFKDIPVLANPMKIEFLPDPDERMRVNFNHYSYIELSTMYLKDFFAVAKRYPKLLLKRHDGSWQRYFTPSTFRAVAGENPSLLAPIVRFFDRYIYLKAELGPPVGPQKTPRQIFLTLLIGLPLLFMFGLHSTFRKKSSLSKPQQVTMGFMLLTIAYLTIVGNIIECGENNRFRFTLDPFFFVLAGLALNTVRDKLSRQADQGPSVKTPCRALWQKAK